MTNQSSWSEGEDEVLTAWEAFLVMSDFVWEFAGRPGNDLMQLTADVEVLGNMSPGDPGAWSDWLESVRHIKRGGAPRY